MAWAAGTTPSLTFTLHHAQVKHEFEVRLAFVDANTPFHGHSRYNCARCGQTTDTTLREHYKQVHQDKCSILFKGEYRKITVKRNENGLWVCPRCVEVWSGSCRKMQASVRYASYANTRLILLRTTPGRANAGRKFVGCIRKQRLKR